MWVAMQDLEKVMHACPDVCTMLAAAHNRNYTHVYLHTRTQITQFGFGIQMGVKQRRAALAAAAQVVIDNGAGSGQLREALGEWLKVCGVFVRW